MSYIRLVTWNVDFDSPFNYERFTAIAEEVLGAKPGVVLFQEVSDLPFSSWQGEKEQSTITSARQHDSCYKVLLRRLEALYEPIVDLGLPSEQAYFVMAFVDRSKYRVHGYEYTEFENSSQGRGLLAIQLEPRDMCGDFKFRVLTSHLESGTACSEVRVQQMRQIAYEMLEGDTPAIFAGDTNFREKEKAGFEKEIAKAIGSEEMRLFDLFVEVGEPSHLRFTWDTRTNTNKVKELPPRFRPRARFDQVLFTRPFQANAMRLLGRERLGHAVFPSDHYGIYGELRF